MRRRIVRRGARRKRRRTKYTLNSVLRTQGRSFSVCWIFVCILCGQKGVLLHNVFLLYQILNLLLQDFPNLTRLENFVLLHTSEPTRYKDENTF